MGTQLQVILTESVAGLGKPGDVVRVATGYARNFLIPRSLGVTATDKNKRRYEGQLVARRRADAQTLSDAEEAARQFEGVTCIIAANAGEGGRLFGSVTSSDIADVLATKGFTIDRRRIQLEESIREVGKHSVDIRLHSEITVTIQVEVIRTEPVEAEGEDDEPES
jgi:large subunit ribosomal protein L9